MPIPNTRTRTSHSLAIRAKGITVGLIQKWNITLSRDIAPVFELNPLTSGKPVDNVPGNDKGFTVEVTRVDLYNKKMEEAFGTVDLSLLSDQSDPFEVHEVWTNPDGTTSRYVYERCWFSKIARSMDSTGDRIVKADGTLTFLNRRRA